MNDYRRFLTFVFLLMISGSAALAQELMKVAGLVVDQNADPLIGVTVRVQGDNKVLDDVVVVGYGVQKKSSVTGAISQVKKEDMENRTITNAKSALQGKTAGRSEEHTSELQSPS